MNVRPYSLLNKRGDKKYGHVHALALGSFNRSTRCGRTTETPLGYWEETDEPVTCPKCLRYLDVPKPTKIEEDSENQRSSVRLKGIPIKRLEA